MEYISVIWEVIIPFLVVLTILVFVHEWGHYLIARRCNVRVEVFSVGFGPEIKGWTDAAGTRWKLSAIPLGGYVKMFGEGESLNTDDGEREMTPEERARSFHHKTLGQRSAIVFAGPAINFLFAVVVFAGLFSIVGEPNPMAAVGRVTDNSAAAAAGLKTGDRILAVDGRETPLFSDLQAAIRPNPGVTLRLDVLRGEQRISITATPRPQKSTEPDGTVREIGLLGVGPNSEFVTYIPHNPFIAVWLGIQRSYAVTRLIIRNLGEMVSGDRSAKELGGPIRIAQISGQLCQGGIFDCLHFMAVLSVNLGLLNLFPIPLLDGGHLAFFAAEKVRGRPLGPRAQEYGFRLGLAFVLGLFIFVTWNDLVQLRFFEFVANLFT